MSDVLGLDRQMHEAYRVLLDQRECTTAEVADRLGISRPLAEQTLQRLAAAGLVTSARPSSPLNTVSNGSPSTSTSSTTSPSTTSSNGNPATPLSPSNTNGSTHDVVALTPVDPRRTLGPLLARKQAQIAAQQQELARAHEAVQALASAYSTQVHDEPERPGKPDVSRGMSAVRSRVEELFASATSTVVCVLAEGTRGVALDVRADAIQQTLDRGVAVKALMARGLISDPVVLNQIRWLQSVGGLARTATLMPPPMMVVDGTIALVPADGQTATALVVRNRAMARALSSLFEHVWGHARAATTMPASATPLADAQLVEREPSPAELDLLRLLGKGMTDASAARHLGVSLRTVRRMMAELMGRLDARSRFEAGIRAAEHGWVGAARQLANGSSMTAAGKLPPGPGRRRLVAG